MLLRKLLNMWRCESGQSAMIFAIAAVPLLVAIGGALEYSDMSGLKNRLQTAADAGALAGAGRLSLASTTGDEDARRVAIRTAQDNLKGDSATFTVDIDRTAGTLTVNAAAEHHGITGVLGDKVLRASAVGEALQKTPLCVLQVETGGIVLSQTAAIKAPGCMIHANNNISVTQSAMITGKLIQASGTVTGATNPAGNGGALPIPDPFNGMNLNPSKLCDTGVQVAVTPLLADATVAPGVHCLPILAVGDTRVTLLPGDHYFMGGLNMTNNTTLEGDDVALIFGPAQMFNFADKADVRLTARKAGPFAGFLIATTRANTNTFKISSTNVSQLLGTIYIPNATLQVTSQGSVGQDSDWSIVVAKKLELKNSPVLVINTRYSGSGVPVPEGVGPRSATVLKQ
ncbi:hypothetical protein ABI_30470 [Asticcacaulis biprosthecium C19]|uniref:Putative Flp pilus-assembly TadG-like N-terminal domain-containing protein n=1 Tax=Asticcacaulis biprosthecium C19 TaxID=715226 RepID=F4QN39_9CAUL|nr:pilus assembly protein TadG-related protein [Asticcacaulis biprosthecium]EGF91630.1 hypothetical protein ABI_30470 [Asticcacaulis biprosthecium C19]